MVNGPIYTIMHSNLSQNSFKTQQRIHQLPTMHFLSFLLFLFLLFFSALSLPTALLTAIKKEPSILQYTTKIHLKTPRLKPTKLLLDLDSSFLWAHCETKYTSSPSYNPVPCSSSLCSSIASVHNLSRPSCANNTCALFPHNPLTQEATLGKASRDSLALHTTNGRNPGQLALISNFTFACSPPQLLNGMRKGITGVLALGRSDFSLPAQVSTSLCSPYLFALCLSGSPSAPGVGFFGSPGPYVFLPEIDLSTSLNYTPLLDNPVGSHEYLIGVHSIKVNDKVLPLSTSPLTAKLSTVVPYTKMESSLYKAFTRTFVQEAADSMQLSVTNPLKPFEKCYLADTVRSTRLGPDVPTVNLVMERDDVFWRMFGANLMVRIVEGNRDLWCLGFVDGGTNLGASIVIGGHQMDDNLLQFDLELKRFGFSSSLLVKETTCANFNFTANK